MTITIQKASNLKAEGHHINGNCKPVFCITTGSVYASVYDAAEKLGIDPSCISSAANGRTKTCQGKRYCFVANVMEHLDEIAENFRIREEKIAAYDAIVYEREAKQRALEKIEKHNENCVDIRMQIVELQKKLEAETKLRKEAQDTYNSLISK